jgi:hypothetical protein
MQHHNENYAAMRWPQLQLLHSFSTASVNSCFLYPVMGSLAALPPCEPAQAGGGAASSTCAS